MTNQAKNRCENMRKTAENDRKTECTQMRAEKKTSETRVKTS